MGADQLIYYLKEGTKRFSDLRRDNPTVSHKMLTLELRKLEDAGIVRRTEFDGYPLRVEYDLTPAGEKLVLLIEALGDWWEDTEGNIEEQGSNSLDIVGSEAARPSLIKN